MSGVNEPLAAPEIEALRRDNEALLAELENAYAQLTAILQVTQDETRIAYSELQEKVVVLEKKLFELSFLSSVGTTFAVEPDLATLRRRIVEKLCLILPVDLVSLHLVDTPGSCTQRQREVVREVELEPAAQAAIDATLRRLDRDGMGSLLVDDLDAAPEDAGLRLRPDARSAAAVPLRGIRLVGLLILNSRLRSNFRSDQEPFLGAFGAQAAAAVENALRHACLQDVVARLLVQRDIDVETLVACMRTPPSGTRAMRLPEVREAVRRLCAENPRHRPAPLDPKEGP